MKNKYPLENKRVWITGASAGIGKACAKEFSDRGAKVILSSRSEDKLQAVSDEIAAPETTMVLPLDVTDKDANINAVAVIEKAWGGLDMALFNAGNCEYVDPAHFDSAVFERMFRINFFSMVYGIEAVLPALRKSTAPCIAAMSSATAYGPLPTAEAYGASKAAIKYLFETLQMTLADSNIPLTVICPGFVKTPLTDKNEFPMPFIIESSAAARRVANGIERGSREIHFPKRFTLPYKAMAMLPNGIYQWLVRAMIKQD